MIQIITHKDEKKYIFQINDKDRKDISEDKNSLISVSRSGNNLKIKRLKEEITIPLTGHNIENLIQMILEVKPK